MTNAFDTTGPSIFTKKSRSNTSIQTQAKLAKKPRGKEAPIKGSGPIPGLNDYIFKGKK